MPTSCGNRPAVVTALAITVGAGLTVFDRGLSSRLHWHAGRPSRIRLAELAPTRPGPPKLNEAGTYSARFVRTERSSRRSHCSTTFLHTSDRLGRVGPGRMGRSGLLDVYRLYTSIMANGKHRVWPNSDVRRAMLVSYVESRITLFELSSTGWPKVMSPQVVLIIAGLVLIVLAILGSGDYVKVVIPSLAVWARVLLAIVGVAVFTLAFIPGITTNLPGAASQPPNSVTPSPSASAKGGLVSPSPTSDGQPINQKIRIIKPSAGSYVDLNNDIKIQLQGVSMSRQVWILVQLGTQVYPQGPCNTVSLTVTLCPDVRFGDPGMRYGTPYELTAVVVSAHGSDDYKPFIGPGFSKNAPPVSPILSSSSITVHGRE